MAANSNSEFTFRFEFRNGLVLTMTAPAEHFDSAVDVIKHVAEHADGKPRKAKSQGKPQDKPRKAKSQKAKALRFFPGDLPKTLRGRCGGAYRSTIESLEHNGEPVFTKEDIDAAIETGEVVETPDEDDYFLSTPNADAELREIVDAFVAKATSMGGSIGKHQAGAFIVKTVGDLYSTDFLSMLLEHMVEIGVFAEGDKVYNNQTYVLMQDV